MIGCNPLIFPFHCIHLAIQCFEFQAESPSSGGFTAIGFYLLTSLFFLTFAFIESICVIYLLQREKKYRVMDDTVTKWKRSIKTNNARISNTKVSSSQRPAQKQKCLQHHVVDIQRIDFYAFIVSALSFLVFNVGYWIAFLFSPTDN